jgi:pimeloyl-ACP methyl ester carboxylesterase
MTALVLIAIFMGLLVMAVTGKVGRGPHRTAAVSAQLTVGAPSRQLFVLIHGLRGSGSASWGDVQPLLVQKGDVLTLDYDAGVLSNADPDMLAASMEKEIQMAHASRGYSRIVVIGHSIGALLARKTYLIGANSAAPGAGWSFVTERIVLLAGMNRGWDATGKRPLDLAWPRRMSFWFGAWFGRLTRTGGLILGVETGAPFISNLRLEWMRHFGGGATTPLVVQLLGDIDDIVSDEDNKDLRAAAVRDFFWIRVRGTGHGQIVELSDSAGARPGYAGIGDYRRSKLLLAIDGTPQQLRTENEEQPFQTDDDVEQIVFVLHGIRDLGEWSAHFESRLRASYRGSARSKLVVVSVRYGYFSMGSFLFRPDRQKYVRWFMDEYTETLARYPNAKQIDFIGHSNGTYLLTSALEQYKDLKIDRVVFGGSVVRQDYDWEKRFADGQVQAVRNYVSTDDWVVALFPRFIETLRGDVGSAGFHGFKPDVYPIGVTPSGAAQLQNIGFLTGGHDAFLDVVPDIAHFLLPSAAGPPTVVARNDRGNWQPLKVVSDWGTWLVWLVLAAIVGFTGVRVAFAANEFAWLPAVLYALLILGILATA